MLTKREAASDTRDFFHLFATRTFGAGDEAEVGESSTNGRRLGVLETGDGVDVAVTLSLACPTGCRREGVVGATIDERLEGDFSFVARYQLGVDPSLRVARIEKLDPLGDRCVLIRIEERIGF